MTLKHQNENQDENIDFEQFEGKLKEFQQTVKVSSKIYDQVLKTVVSAHEKNKL